ncbi:MAG: thymidine phosphorylase [Ignavibacteria bacterium]
MNIIEIIKKKRDNQKLTKSEIDFVIKGVVSGTIADYQISALIMAIYLNKLDEEETFYLTESMLKSGEVIDLGYIQKPKIDKHSTGGVGDKVSLIIAPIVASCGIVVPMISGRGLGHTGGTLDKLESIPDFDVNLSIRKYKSLLNKIGVALIGQTDNLAPADKKIYAIRDVTATVDNVSLVTASIMSKKLAEGADGFVFDIKIGSGANLQNYSDCIELTKYLLGISRRFNKKAIAVLTDMEEPLGNKIGNWLEVEESIEVLNGVEIDDLLQISLKLAGAMIYLGEKARTISEGEEIAIEKIKSGEAFKKFLQIVKYQKGNVKYVLNWSNFKRASKKRCVYAQKDGYINKMDAYKFGLAAVELGCGRKKVDDSIDYRAGIILKKKVGDRVKKGEVICELYSSENIRIQKAFLILSGGIVISKNKPPLRQLIKEVIKIK